MTDTKEDLTTQQSLLHRDHDKEMEHFEKEPTTQSRSVGLQLRKVTGKVCSKRFLYQRLPFLSWITTYSLEMLVCDLIAGLTTALTVIPQGIGYAPLAGLPLQYGLYASIVPGFVYCLLGTTRQATVGPTAVNFLMSYNYAGGVPYKAVTLAFWSGLIEILAGVCNLGFLIQFISGPVISSFTSVVSILVITSCLKGFFGIRFEGRGFIRIYQGLFANISSINYYDTLIGFVSMAILFFLRKLKEYDWGEGENKESRRARMVKKTKWLLSISANCIVMLTMSVVPLCLLPSLLTLTGEVEGGLPAWQLPWQFNRNYTATNQTRDDITEPFTLAGELGLGLAMIPLVSILQHLAIAKHYAGNKRMAASQEMIALGFCQFIGSFTGSAAVTASFGRSAVNATSGVRSPLGGVVTGLIIILTCAFLSPYLASIPTSALSAVIIFAMFFTIDYSVPVKLWRGRRVDLMPYSLTFVLGLLVSVEVGLIAGTLLHIVMLVHSSSAPAVDIQHRDAVLTITFGSSIYFPAKDHIVREISKSLGESQTFIFEFTRVEDIDHTIAVGLSGLFREITKSSKTFLICGANLPVSRVLNSAYGKDLQVYKSLDHALRETNC